MKAVTVGHDPYWRLKTLRRNVPATDRKVCAWCQLKTGRFQFGTQHEAGHVEWITSGFCSVRCYRDSGF